MSTKEAAAKEAATARANLNTWAAVVALMENGLLSGPRPCKWVCVENGV